MEEIPAELTEEKNAAPAFQRTYMSIPQQKNYTQQTGGFRPSFGISADPSKPRMQFTAGDRVHHKKFGDGMVLSAVAVGNDTKLQIAFDSVGTKTLLALYANLTKL